MSATAALTGRTDERGTRQHRRNRPRRGRSPVPLLPDAEAVLAAYNAQLTQATCSTTTPAAPHTFGTRLVREGTTSPVSGVLRSAPS
ncbi:hypothetical protein AB0J51_18360 [Micromonospora echinofusca]|uniref:hypothetical protein n=1 Tax=Micromonospora echinofusca TaxID=47858 RepID=UPI003443152A